MRRSLFTAASIIALAAAPAFAQESDEDVNIDDTREEPVDTATADEGSAANIVIGAGGRVQLNNTEGPAVRVNSNNDLTVASGGRIEIFDTDADGADQQLDGAVGVQVDPGVEADINHGGTIVLEDSYRASADEDDLDLDDGETADGEADGPFATDTNKTGLLIGAVDDDGNAVAGQAGVTGSVNLQPGSLVNVAGQDSYGVRTVADISGDFISAGRVSLRGENSRGISLEGDVGGDVAISNMNVSAPGSSAVVVDGDVAGGVRFNGEISVSGYRLNQRLAESFMAQLDEDDVLSAGNAIVIAGQVQDGVFFAAGADIRFGSGGDGVVIGSAGETLTIGRTELPDDFLAQAGEGDEDTDRDQLDHAVINQGRINATTVIDGQATTAFLIGGLDENGQPRAVILEGAGFSNSGEIGAEGFDADTTGLVVGAGTEADEILNTGTIFARTNIGYENDVFADDQYAAGRSLALHLAEGSSIQRLLNEGGDIIATLQTGSGPDAQATAIKVDSDTLSQITNTGRILTRLVGEAPLEREEAGGSRLIAVDARGHDNGLTLVQSSAGGEAEAPVIEGDILFGDGDDTLDMRAGSIDGALSFGLGSDRLLINGATVNSAIDDADGDLEIEVTDGGLVLSGDAAVELSRAVFNEGATLEVRIEESDRAATPFINTSGDVNFNSGSAVTVSLERLIGPGDEFQIIHAGALNIADDADVSAADAPFLYNAELQRAPDDQNRLVLTLTRKSADELGMNEAQAAAYDEAFRAFEAIEGLNAAFAGVRSADEFFGGYNQLLPEYAASAIQFALANNDAASGALSARLRNARAAPDELAGVWAQEFGYFADRAGTAFGPGYRGQGVGLAIGLDRPIGPFYAAGISLVGSASEIDEVSSFDEPMVALSGQIGGYAAADLGGFDISGSLGVGYDRFETERRLLIGDFSAFSEADWSGWHVAASAVAGRDFISGRWVIRPEASVTWLTLFESGYEETIQDEANAALALIVDDRESTSFSAAGTVNIARRFGGDQSWWAPHLRVGYRGEFDDATAETTARFGETGSPFTLQSSALPGSGYLLGFGLSAGSDYSTFTFAYDADVRDDFVRHVARLVIRLTF